MKKQIKGTFGKLFALAAVAIVLTGAAFAQMPNRSANAREQLNHLLRGQEKSQINTLAVLQKSVVKSNAVTLTNSTNFQIGKDFSLAIFDAAGLDEYEDSMNYTIVDLVYLIDSIDGQPESVTLQKTLKSLVRGTSDTATVKKEIENASKSYLARQKVDQKWYFNAGQTSMNLMISTYMGEDAQIKKGLTDLQALIKVAPSGTPKEVLDPIGSLAKYVAKTTYTEDEYMAIYEGIGNVINAITA